MKSINWTIKHFDELTTLELYNFVTLREEIFIVEQQCIFLDADGLDTMSHHLLAYEDSNLIAYLRIVPPNSAYNEVSLGRIVVKQSHRSLGIGKELVKKGIEAIIDIYGHCTIRIAAQTYLDKFYTMLGFTSIEEPFILDGIPHQYMIITTTHCKQ